MNNPRDFWQHLLQAVQAGQRCVLMCVVESTGSSPGRAGFKMFVSSSGTMCGSIGGGSMEHKLVELARSLMDQPAAFPFLKRQIHREGEARDRSGMICSGEQTVAFYLLLPQEEEVIRRFISCVEADAQLEFRAKGIELVNSASAPRDPAEVWYSERLDNRSQIAIVGGGHVGLALSRIMHQLGFHVLQFDHRDELNTMTSNEWAHERQIVDFERIEDFMPDDPALFIALVSHGYRTDDIVLRRLIRNRYKYIGMLGSAEKVRVMFDAMRRDGFTDAELARVHAPIGLQIRSKTPEEIAVSIAAEIIRVKNG